MSLIRWDSFRELEDVAARLNRFFGRPMPVEAGKETLATTDWSPAVDVAETVEEYLVKAELPEVKKEDVQVTIENGVLRIKGERKLEKEEKGKKFHRVERFYGAFMRTFTVPENADETKVQAEFKDGVLTIHLPKSQTALPRPVEVKVT